MTRPGALTTRQGVTLLEALVVILMVAAGIAAVLQTVSVSLRLAQQSHRAFIAAKGVQEYQLEGLRSLTFNNAAPHVGTSTTPANFTTPALDAVSDVDKLPGGSAQYTVSLEGGSADLKRVTMTVTWTDADGRTRPSTASTLISQ